MNEQLGIAAWSGPANPTFRRRLAWAGFMNLVFLLGFIEQIENPGS